MAFVAIVWPKVADHSERGSVGYDPGITFSSGVEVTRFNSPIFFHLRATAKATNPMPAIHSRSKMAAVSCRVGVCILMLH